MKGKEKKWKGKGKEKKWKGKEKEKERKSEGKKILKILLYKSLGLAV